MARPNAHPISVFKRRGIRLIPWYEFSYTGALTDAPLTSAVDATRTLTANGTTTLTIAGGGTAAFSVGRPLLITTIGLRTVATIGGLPTSITVDSAVAAGTYTYSAPSYGQTYPPLNLSGAVDAWQAGISSWLTPAPRSLADTANSQYATLFGATPAGETMRSTGITNMPGVTLNNSGDSFNLTDDATWQAAANRLADYITYTGSTEFVIEGEGFLGSYWSGGPPAGLTVSELAEFQQGLARWKAALVAAGVTKVYFWPGFSADTDAYTTGTLADILSAINNGLAPTFITSRVANEKYLRELDSGNSYVAAETILKGITSRIAPVIWPYWFVGSTSLGFANTYPFSMIEQSLQNVLNHYPDATECFVLLTPGNLGQVGVRISELWDAF